MNPSSEDSRPVIIIEPSEVNRVYERRDHYQHQTKHRYNSYNRYHSSERFSNKDFFYRDSGSIDRPNSDRYYSFSRKRPNRDRDILPVEISLVGTVIMIVIFIGLLYISQDSTRRSFRFE